MPQSLGSACACAPRRAGALCTDVAGADRPRSIAGVAGTRELGITNAGVDAPARHTHPASTTALLQSTLARPISQNLAVQPRVL